MIAKVLSVWSVFLLSVHLFSGNNVLFDQFKTFSADPALKHANWSFLVIDLETGDQIIAHNHQRAIVPASVQKLITTASAMIVFPHDHTFSTKLQHDGVILSNGVLEGNLFIVGSGDPSLGSSFWHDSLDYKKVARSFSKALQSKNIRHITGHIIADDRLFDMEMLPRKWLWEDMGNYFGTGSNAITFNENTFSVRFDAGQTIGSDATMKSVEPVIPDMALHNHVTTAERGSGDQVYIFGAPMQNDRRLYGTVPLEARNFPVKGSIPDPALFTVQYLHHYFIQQGISFDGIPIKFSDIQPTNQQPRYTIHEWVSPDLSALVYRTNMNSVNIYAENLLKLIGLQILHEGSFNAGLDAVYKIWTERGMDLSGMALHDGSGLSPSNRLTAEQIGFVLQYMWQHDEFPVFLESLPLAGRSGSLTSFFLRSSSEGVLRAKSGFLNNVRSYAGYTNSQSGRPFAFVLIVNDYEGTPAAMRQKMLRLLDAITSLDD